MKKLMLTLSLVVLALGARAQIHEMYIEDFTIEPGTVLEVPVMLHCQTPSRGMQFNLHMCEGLSLDDVTLSDESIELDMNMFYRKTDEGYYTVVAYPSQRVCYDTIPLPVVYVHLEAAQDFKGGILRMTKVRGATLDNKSIKMNDTTTIVSVPEQGAGVTTVPTDATQTVGVDYYTMTGVPTARPDGIAIQVTRYSDGTRASRTVLPRE